MADDLFKLTQKMAELEQQLDELKAAKQQLDLVIKSTGVGIWEWEVQTGKTQFNERWANIIGYRLSELEPVSIDTWIEYAHPDDLQESDRRLKECWSGKTDYYLFESRMKHRDGHWVWVYDTGQVVEWQSPGVPKKMIGTHLDITEQKAIQEALKESNQQLEELIRIDPLTAVSNRRGYEEQLQNEIQRANRLRSPLSMLMIDIDHFKAYNDLYGHQKGDEILQSIAAQLKKSLHRSTDFVARFGGEEFVVLLPHTDMQEAGLTAQKILDDICHLELEHDQSFHDKKITVSIGVATAESDAVKLFKQADDALYKAKSLGRNRYELAEETKTML